MKMAYILLVCEAGYEKDVVERLKEIPQVKEAHILYGVYDVIIRVEVESLDELNELVTQKIRGIRGVTRSFTMIVASSS